jgi:hypothetical protein
MNTQANLFAQKTIIIETGKTSLSEDDIKVYRNSLCLELNISSVCKIEKGNIYYLGEIGDSVIFKIGKCVPLIFRGFAKLKQDTIIISQVPLDEYIPVDTVYNHSTEYTIKDDTVMQVTKEKRWASYPENSKKFRGEKRSVMVNKVKYPIAITSEPNEVNETFCTPGMHSSDRKVVGVTKYYVVDM